MSNVTEDKPKQDGAKVLKELLSEPEIAERLEKAIKNGSIRMGKRYF